MLLRVVNFFPFRGSVLLVFSVSLLLGCSLGEGRQLCSWHLRLIHSSCIVIAGVNLSLCCVVGGGHTGIVGLGFVAPSLRRGLSSFDSERLCLPFEHFLFTHIVTRRRLFREVSNFLISVSPCPPLTAVG